MTISRLGKKFFKVVKAIDKLSKAKASFMKQSKRYRAEKEFALRLINKAFGYILTSAIYSIRDLIRNEQNSLYRLIVSNQKYQNQVKFDFQLEFDHNGSIIPNPSFDEYTTHIMSLYESIRKSIVTEKAVEGFLFDIVTISKDELDKKGGY